jgi:N-methylhydantoinase B
MDRTRFRPWGVQGGGTGARMLPALLNPGTDREQSIRKINFLKLVPGDRVRITTSGGGGYGDPLERDPENVRLDAELGFVSPGRAESDYGVVVDALGKLDEKATAKLRDKLRAARKGKPLAMFCLGPEREEYESWWSQPARDALADILSRLPILVRYRIKNEIHGLLFKSERSAPITREEINKCWTGLRPTFYPERYLADQFLPKGEAAPQA